jgi:hypothetical protein
MRFNSKRWWKAQRRKTRRLRRFDLSWAPNFPKRIKLHNDEAKIERYNRAVQRLNRNLRNLDKAFPLLESLAECPVCGSWVPLWADADEWTRNDNPAWRRCSWDVTGYWPGIGQCCGLLIAPDFEQRCIVADETEYQAAVARHQSTLLRVS